MEITDDRLKAREGGNENIERASWYFFKPPWCPVAYLILSPAQTRFQMIMREWVLCHSIPGTQETAAGDARCTAITPLIGSLNHFVSCQSESGMRQEDTGDGSAGMQAPPLLILVQYRDCDGIVWLGSRVLKYGVCQSSGTVLEQLAWGWKEVLRARGCLLINAARGKRVFSTELRASSATLCDSKDTNQTWTSGLVLLKYNLILILGTMRLPLYRSSCAAIVQQLPFIIYWVEMDFYRIL